VRALALVLVLAGCGQGARTFEEPLVLGGRTVEPDVLNRGEFAYMRHCRGCHGQIGRGDGPYASSLPTRPTDLTLGQYAQAGPGLPSDEALARVIRDGAGAMPAQPVAPSELDPLVQYVKTLAPIWREPR
jgi:mono/diheme cytochrome c family protein